MSYHSLQGNNLQQLSQQVQQFGRLIKTLSGLVRSVGTFQDGQSLRNQISKVRGDSFKLSQKIVRTFKSSKPNRSEQLKYQNISKQFDGLFKQYQALNQEYLEKQKVALRQDEEKHSMTLGMTLEQRESLAFNNIQELDEAFLRERQQEIKGIENQIQLVNGLFKDIANLVVEQGGMLDEAENDVINADEQTKKAVIELGKAEQYQKKSRRKLVCILVIVVLIVGVIVAVVMGIAL